MIIREDLAQLPARQACRNIPVGAEHDPESGAAVSIMATVEAATMCGIGKVSGLHKTEEITQKIIWNV